MEHSVRWEWIKISRSEITDYNDTTMSGDDCQAKICYKKDGSINVLDTYSRSYRRDHHLGEFANQDDESKAQAARNKAKKDGGGSSGCCSICKCIWKIVKCSV